MLRDVLCHYSHTLASVAALLPVWCWWWRNKEGAAAAAAVVVVVVLESCHQQRGQHHQQQRPEPAPRCSRSCGISSSTHVGSLPFPPLPSRAGRPWGPGQENNFSGKDATDTLALFYVGSTQYSSAHLWCEGVVDWCGWRVSPSL